MEEQSPLSMQPGSIPVFNALRRHSHLPCSGLSWSILARPCQSRCQSHNDISISRVQPLCQEGTNSYEHHQTTCLTSHLRPQLPSYSSFCLSRGHQAQQKVYIKKASFRHKLLDDSCRILLVDLEWSRSLKASFFAYFTFLHPPRSPLKTSAFLDLFGVVFLSRSHFICILWEVFPKLPKQKWAPAHQRKLQNLKFDEISVAVTPATGHHGRHCSSVPLFLHFSWPAPYALTLQCQFAWWA